MSRSTLPRAAMWAALLSLSSCLNSDQGQSALEADAFATAAVLRIEEVHNGFGRLLPHVVHRVDPKTGEPSASQLVEIRTLEDLLQNPSSDRNPVLPPATWPQLAINPNNVTANHFVAVRFSRSLKLNSILDDTAGGLSQGGMTGAVRVVAYDPETGFSESVPGRGFINGYTYEGNPPRKERWLRRGGRNRVAAAPVRRSGETRRPGIGFPGTNDLDQGIFDGSFTNAGSLIAPTTLVFVVDSDNDLSTYETFPPDRVIRVVISEAVEDLTRRRLEDAGVATSTVGADNALPRPLLDGISGRPVTTPIDLATGVACDTPIAWSFSEAVQPHSLGPLPSGLAPAPSPEFTVEFTPPYPKGEPEPQATLALPYVVRPVSPYDFTRYELQPVAPFPGTDPQDFITKASVTYFHNAAIDLFGNQDENSNGADRIRFFTGNCPGLVNVPVAPGVILVGSNGGGEAGGIRAIDLDGYGQGTGDPTHDSLDPRYNVTFDANGIPIAGDVSKFPFNPNLSEQDIFPPLAVDHTTLAGGSRGVFQLAQDSRLKEQLVAPETVGTIGDMMLGHPLDLLYNNYLCVSPGPNHCAHAGVQAHPLNGATTGAGNPISHAPHPNPPRLKLVPDCFAPLIQAEEPNYRDGNFDGTSATIRLVPGDAFGSPVGPGLNGTGIPPGGLLSNVSHYTDFNGPMPPVPGCTSAFTIRQQIGHFLYVLDVLNDRVVVLNSNRMTVIDEIRTSDPADMAIAPDMNLLAVSNRSTNTITFIDTDPSSPFFHKVVKITALVDRVNQREGRGPGEIVWQPDDEDVLVVCERSQSLALISTGSLEVRKIVPAPNQPKYISVSNRDEGYGHRTGLYYAYLVSEDGKVSIFESGPDGIQGIGFDSLIGIPSLPGRSGFSRASAIQPDPNSLQHGVYIAHQEGGQGAVSALDLHNAPFGKRALSQGPALPDPNFRSKEWRVRRSFVGVFSSSSLVDLALDDLSNIGGISQTTSAYVGGTRTIFHSSKALLRGSTATPGVVGATPVSTPQFLFAANGSGWVDVIDLRTGTPYLGRALRVPGARVLCHYWRQ